MRSLGLKLLASLCLTLSVVAAEPAVATDWRAVEAVHASSTTWYLPITGKHTFYRPAGVAYSFSAQPQQHFSGWWKLWCNGTLRKMNFSMTTMGQGAITAIPLPQRAPGTRWKQCALWIHATSDKYGSNGGDPGSVTLTFWKRG
jgi:hypothetical protein